MTTRESEWTDEEREKVLALLDYEAQLCSGCHGYLPETTDPERAWKAGDPLRCYRCDVLIQKQADYAEQRRPEALQWTVQEK